MGTIVSLKKFFKPKEKPLTFKRAHFLNQLSAHRLEEILLFSEGDHIGRVLPDLNKKKVVFLNDQKHKYTLKKVLMQPAAQVLNYIYKDLKERGVAK